MSELSKVGDLCPTHYCRKWKRSDDEDDDEDDAEDGVLISTMSIAAPRLFWTVGLTIVRMHCFGCHCRVLPLQRVLNARATRTPKNDDLITLLLPSETTITTTLSAMTITTIVTT